jgi:uncharacterized protein (DUF362 family)
MDSENRHKMNRRDFFKSSLAGAAALKALNTGFFTGGQAGTKSVVALVKTNDRARGVKEVLSLLSFSSPKGKSVVIKPNFNTQDPTPGSTHNDTLRQIILEMKTREAGKITIGERSGPPQTKKVMEDKGIPGLAQELGVDVVNFEELGPEGWVHSSPPGNHWSNGFDTARLIAEAEYLVSTCCLKTHGAGGVFSMSLKLAVGTTPKSLMPELHGNRSTHMRRMIAELNQAFKPNVIIMDGTDIFVDGGPSRGKMVTADVFVGGTDRVAVDAVGVAILKHFGSNDAIMSRKIFEQDQIQRAVEIGLGISRPDQIEFATPDKASADFVEKIRPVLLEG